MRSLAPSVPVRHLRCEATAHKAGGIDAQRDPTGRDVEQPRRVSLPSPTSLNLDEQRHDAARSR